VTAEQLRKFGDVVEPRDRGIEAPGQLPAHYAPRSRLVLVDHASAFDGDRSRAALLAWRSVPTGEKFAAARVLSASGDLREAAKNLFRHMRELDALQLETIVAEAVPREGIGEAIMDRLCRAAT
jgi:L-threonylcarbamoyladenylate synthase